MSTSNKYSVQGAAQPSVSPPPKGYWVIAIRVLDQPRYDAYIELATDAIDRAGGDVIVRSIDGIVGAGSALPRVEVVAFPSLADAQAAFESAAQQTAMMMLKGVVEYDLTIVEGFIEP